MSDFVLPPTALFKNTASSGGGATSGNYIYTNLTTKAGTLDATHTATNATSNSITLSTAGGVDYYEVYITGTWNASAGGEMDITFNSDTAGGHTYSQGQQWDSNGTTNWARGTRLQIASVAAAGNEPAAGSTFSFRLFIYNNGITCSCSLFGGFTSTSYGQANVMCSAAYLQGNITSVQLISSVSLQTSTLTDYTSVV